MAQVTVTIAGRAYRMACDEGQEDHLATLGEQLDGRIAELRGSFGEIGDMRLAVMAGVSLADELAEARGRIADLEGRVEELEVANAEANADTDVVEAEIARAVNEAAARVEALAAKVEGR